MPFAYVAALIDHFWNFPFLGTVWLGLLFFGFVGLTVASAWITASLAEISSRSRAQIVTLLKSDCLRRTRLDQSLAPGGGIFCSGKHWMSLWRGLCNG